MIAYCKEVVNSGLKSDRMKGDAESVRRSTLSVFMGGAQPVAHDGTGVAGERERLTGMEKAKNGRRNRSER
jgi:hypothetical protein